MNGDYRDEIGLNSEMPKANEGWLEDALTKLRLVSLELSRCESADSVMKEAIRLGVEFFGFQRIGTWFFENDRKSLIGSFGVDGNGAFVDERHLRIYDRTGSIERMIKAWDSPPHFFMKADNVLRTGPAMIVGQGIQIVAPLVHEGEYVGIFSVDSLLGNSSLNDKTGCFLVQYALVVSFLYFEKKMKENAVRLTEVAVQAEKVKVDFLGMMSHEIRTPLNAIMGYSQLLCFDSNSENTSSLARTIEENGDHLMDLINGMLEYAQLSESDSKAHFSACDPVSIIGSTVDAFVEIARQKNVEITYSHNGNFEGYVLADPVGYRQVITNLIQNAIKFTQSSGRVLVQLQTQKKTSTSIEFYVTVDDTGIGMSKEGIAKIFEPFKQLDSSRTRKAGGVGMGLAIVERLVKGMGGHIDCQSRLGEGTVFSVDFVFEIAMKEELPHSARVSNALISKVRSKKDLRLLIAEDNEENLKVLQSLLNHLGYPKAVFARDGLEAKTLLQSSPYDLIFLDIQMPEMDGLELTLSIRSGKCGPINRETPIVGVSATNLKHDRAQCLITGMTDYVEKPVKISKLKSVLDAIVDAE